MLSLDVCGLQVYFCLALSLWKEMGSNGSYLIITPSYRHHTQHSLGSVSLLLPVAPLLRISQQVSDWE